jgi:P27 family predicted phage terminase small subunit
MAMRGRKPAPEPVPPPVPQPVPATNAPAPPVMAPWDGITEPAWTMTPPGSQSYAAAVADLAAEKWSELLPQMQAVHTIGPENVAALEVLCTLYARWRVAEAQVAALGPLLKAAVTGVPMHNPYLSIANAAASLYLKYAAELGLTPAMRGRVAKRPLKTANASNKPALAF